MPPDVSIDHAAAAAETATHPDALKAWLDALPLAQMLDAGAAVARYVSRLEGLALESRQGIALLGVLRPAADVLLQGLDRVYGRSQPLTPHAREALQLARALAEGLARAHERVADTLEPIGTRDALGLLLRQAMHYHAEALRASYRTYSRVPEGAWRTMHALYLRAEKAGVHASDYCPPSVAQVYGEALLMSLTDPYRFVPGQLDRVLAVLRALPAERALRRDRPATPRGAHFEVPCAEDKPPRPMPEDHVGAALLLDANPVVEALRAAARQVDAADSAAGRLLGPGTLALVTRLAALWSNPPRRVDRRDPAGGSVAICVGVKAIAQFVAHDAAADSDGAAGLPRGGITLPLRSLPEDESGRFVPIHEWAVVNQGEHGLRVRRSARTTAEIAVGDIVGIKAAGKSLWTLGVTRWITALEDGATEFGVQVFGDAVCAVWVRTAGAAPRRLGVLLAAGEEQVLESILAPPHTFAPDREYELRGEEYRAHVKAAGLVEATPGFDLFLVVPA